MSSDKEPNSGSFYQVIKSLINRKNHHEKKNPQTQKKESGIIKNLSAFNEINVSDIMVIRNEIFALPLDSSMQTVLNAMKDNCYTRIPIYKETLDEIIGFIHIKDILRGIGDKLEIKSIIRNIIFVPTPMKAIDLLVKMQNSHIHVAIVLDEYGGTDGLVTIVDIIEEIVGNIDDEHNKNTEPTLIKVGNGKFEVEGRMEISTLESALNMKFSKIDEDYDTVGGLINTLLGRIPETGEIIEDNGIVYKIVEADERCIYKVVINVKGKDNLDNKNEVE